MEIVNIAIDKLKPAEYNPRLDLQPVDKEYQDIKRSVVEFGLVEPLVVNKDMTVIGGHQRLKVLKDLNFTTIPCIIVDLDKQKEKMLNIALNKISGDWDRAKLKDILEELDTGEFDISLTGFGEQEIEDLMTEFHVEPEEDDFDVDKAVEAVGEPICKRGDIWQLGEHRLMCGDATVEEDVKKLMDGKRADMVFTDPPYNVNLQYKNYQDDKTREQYIQWCRDWFSLLSVISDTQILFVGNINTQLWINNFKPDYIAIWDKGDGGTTHGYITQYTLWEPIFFHGNFKRKRHNDIFRFTAGGVKVDHPCPKPIKLLAEIIDNFSILNNIILDSFGGSGSTLIACEQLNRKCFMMEIDPIYCDVIIKRWETYTNKKAVKLN